MNHNIDKEGYYGEFGGAYIPEILHANVERLRENYVGIMNEPEFKSEFDALLRDYVGRPSPLYLAERLSERHGTRIYLKREDLNHTGAHKINNTIGQILLARCRMAGVAPVDPDRAVGGGEKAGEDAHDG